MLTDDTVPEETIIDLGAYRARRAAQPRKPYVPRPCSCPACVGIPRSLDDMLDNLEVITEDAPTP